MRKHNTRAYLVNTGWAGGAYGVGQRMKIKLTRSIIDGIFDGSLEHDDYVHHDILNLDIPNRMGSVDHKLLLPWESWSTKEDYENQARKLAGMFVNNFKQYLDSGSEFDFTAHGPKA